MLYKYGKRTRNFEAFLFYFSLSSIFRGVSNKTIISLALAGYEIIITDLITVKIKKSTATCTLSAVKLDLLYKVVKIKCTIRSSATFVLHKFYEEV